MQQLNEFPSATDSPRFGYDKPIMLLGSCFSTHIADKLKNAGFLVHNNLVGTIFHPIPLARFILETLNESVDERILQREDVFLSYDAASEVYAMSQEALSHKLQEMRHQFRTTLAEAGTLIITFGSAHGYRLKSSGEIVANCHKQPGNLFEKELTEIEEIVEQWRISLQLLKTSYPHLQVVFTLSPVRYLRDGWVENNRSKARLTEVVHVLRAETDAAYFPAYEIVNDSLRDYRYFEKDGAHPNALAVDAVWEVFRKWHIDPIADRVVDEVLAFRAMENHRLLFPESKASKRFENQVYEKREQLRSLYPYVEL